MRITLEALHKAARESAERYARRDRSLVCIYLTGSLLGEEPLLGGTTDIDLIFVHSTLPPYPREIVRLTDEIHLDIAHLPQSVFQQPRRLRADNWIGSFLCANPIVLHDIGHWFEFTQASAGAQFDLPEYVLQRARLFSDQARQSWLDLQSQPAQATPQQIHQYLDILENASNAVSVLYGTPLTERRFLIQFSQRAQAAGRPGMAAGLADLIQDDPASLELIQNLLENWRLALQSAGNREEKSPRLDPTRLPYYERAVLALGEDSPAAALWLLLRTWTRAARAQPDDAAVLSGWQNACGRLGLSSVALPERLKAVDAYLDTVEETLDLWGKQYGV
ncbi:hypothetical protein [Bellilinea sp.]|jgi:hypothetical protein|uniref:hypothetical protein n=1 Tax=Bellilinea sp. TaxID=2838785 RepID=UPI002ADD4229|nr:hypothetical protein [Bellilinea sp.]